MILSDGFHKDVGVDRFHYFTIVSQGWKKETVYVLLFGTFSSFILLLSSGLPRMFVLNHSSKCNRVWGIN